MNINNFIYQKIEQFHRFFNVYISIYIMRIMILYCNFQSGKEKKKKIIRSPFQKILNKIF